MTKENGRRDLGFIIGQNWVSDNQDGSAESREPWQSGTNSTLTFKLDGMATNTPGRHNFGAMTPEERRQAVDEAWISPEDRTPEMQAVVDAWNTELAERTNLAG